jgi:branched-chain amino acid transport system substrate-binding protein
MLQFLTRFRVLMLALGAAALLCPGTARAEDPFTINAIFSMTGYAAFIGQGSAVALRVVEDEVNRSGGIQGRPVHFEIVDDQSNPATARALADQIIAKGAAVILGPALTSNCEAVFPQILANGPVDYCGSPSVFPKAGSYAFALGPSFRDLSVAMMRYLRAKGWKRVAILATTDASGQVADREGQSALALPENKDMTLVATEHFGVADVGIGAQVARIRSANPDAILAEVTGTPLGTVLHGLHDAGIDIPVITNAGNINASQIQSYAAFLPATMLFTGFAFMAPDLQHDRRVRELQQQFSADVTALKAEPAGPTASTYDPVRVVVDAFRHLGTKATAAQIRDYIEHVKGFPSIDGLMDFTDGNQRGIEETGVVIVQWDGTKRTFVPVSRYGGAP